MDFGTWLQDNVGKVQLTPDPPNGINGQCVNLASSRTMQAVGVELFGNGNDDTAFDIWQTFSHPALQKIVNAPDNAPAPGDIVFFAPGNAAVGTGSAGHVDVAVDNISTSSFRALDSDWNGSPAAQYVAHGYAGVLGWFSPIAPPPPAPTDNVDVPTADNDGVVNGADLHGHSAPNLASSVPFYFDNNEHITLISHTLGDNVTTGPYAPSNIWYQAKGSEVDAVVVWVSDAYVRTTHTPANVPEYTPADPAAPVPVVPAPLSYPTVIDVSHAQGDIDWPAVSVAGAIISAGHTGATFGGVQPHNTDPKFAANRDGARAKGIAHGFYWYGYPSLDPVQEAKDFVASVGDLVAGESLWLDMEESGVTDSWVSSFQDTVETLTGRVCNFYSYKSFLANNVLPSATKVPRRLWEANYNNLPGTDVLPVAVLHQYTDKGASAGITGAVDLSAVLVGKIQDYAVDITPPASPAPTPSVPNPAQSSTPTASPPTPFSLWELLVELIRRIFIVRYFKEVQMLDLSKAIAGGVAGLVIALAARYGLNADPSTINAISVLITAVVGYAVGHLAVYFAPKNTTGGTPNVG